MSSIEEVHYKLRQDSPLYYDVYYSTGGVSNIGGGSDVWVRHWIEEIAPKLNKPFYLLIDRNRLETDKDVGIQAIYRNHPDFHTILDNTEKIHILHGYYEPTKIILDNADKIETNIMHCTLYKSLRAHHDLGLSWLKHFKSDFSWESKMLDVAKRTIWIGLSDTDYHKDYDIIDIPNFYEFKGDSKAVESNTVGFCSRMETRKAPHFLEDIPSYFFTRVDHFQEWRKKLNLKFNKSKLYQYRWEKLKKFLQRDDWGISHSAHIYEPFGYSIFQAVDYGKIPIISEDWLHEIEYPFRASTKEKFEECWKQICELDTNQRQGYIDYLRDKLNRYTNKKEWVDKYLEIYNS